MKYIKGLGVATAALAMLVGTSAFAESRHRGETKGDRGSSSSPARSNGGQVHQRRDEGRSQQQAARAEQGQAWRNTGRISRDQQPSSGQQQYQRQQPAQSYQGRTSSEQYRGRNNAQQYGSHDQQYRGGQNGQQYHDRGRAQSANGYGQNGSRSQSYGYHNTSYNSYGHYDSHGRTSMFREGHVDRIMHEQGGYRVWVGGFGFPFWIPEVRWASWPLRVGLSIRIGGWWDPLGYYNAYDVGPMGGYYSTPGNIHGVVESVDYRRGAVVIRDDISNSFVTIALRGSDPRLGDLRPGDYADLSGQWTRGGIFEAYRLEALNGGRAYVNQPYDNGQNQPYSNNQIQPQGDYWPY